MRTLDLSPLYRTGVGFDRLVRLLDMNIQQDSGYPPYNIEAVEENAYEISIAVAGFSESELDIVSENNTLTVSGKKESDGVERSYLHQGIAYRSFERRFQLADYVKVVAAKLENGLLQISLEREVPDAMKPRKIEIGTGSAKVIEQNAKSAA